MRCLTDSAPSTRLIFSRQNINGELIQRVCVLFFIYMQCMQVWLFLFLGGDEKYAHSRAMWL